MIPKELLEKETAKRREAEKQLKESQEKYRAIFEASADGIIIADIKTKKFLYSNPALCRMLGYNAEELRTLGVQDIHPKESIRHVFSEFQAQAEGKKSLAVNIPCLKKDGTVMYADINTTKGIIEGKECNIGFFRDATDRRKTEQALKESEAKIKNIMDSSPDAITVTDLQGNVIECNQETAKLHGFASKEEVIGTNSFKFISEKDHKKAMHNLNKTLKYGKSKNLEYTLKRKDGTEFPGELSASIIKDAHGKPIAFMAITKDITERKKIEAEKEELQRKLKQYAKRLEIKLKTYEKRRIKLTENEKTVLYGIARYPSLSDEKLSLKIKIKRSTITSIKNKLRKQNIYSRVNIPDMHALGCELITFTYAKFTTLFPARKEIIAKHMGKIMHSSPHVYLQSTDEENISITISKNLEEFQKKYESLYEIFIKNKMLTEAPKLIHIPFGISKIFSYFNFAPFLNELFELKQKKQEIEVKHPKRRLRKNEKIILYTLVKYPELNNAELARKTRLTQITVASIKKKLISEGFLVPAVIPNIKKLGCEYLIFENSKEIKSTYIPNSFVDVRGANQSVKINIFKEFAADDKNSESYKFLVQETKNIKIDFAPLLKETLELEEDF